MAKPKTVDTWKTKSWYTIFAPEIFDKREIGHLLASEDKYLINRKISVGLEALTGDFSQAFTALQFRINEIKGKSAYTKLIGHSLSRSYLKTLVRRRRDVIYDVIDIVTKDGVPIRLKVATFTSYKVSGTLKTSLRKAVKDEVANRAKDMDFALLAQEVIFKKFASRIYNKAKKLAPLKRVEVHKSEVQEKFV